MTAQEELEKLIFNTVFDGFTKAERKHLAQAILKDYVRRDSKNKATPTAKTINYTHSGDETTGSPITFTAQHKGLIKEG